MKILQLLQNIKQVKNITGMYNTFSTTVKEIDTKLLQG